MLPKNIPHKKLPVYVCVYLCIYCVTKAWYTRDLPPRIKKVRGISGHFCGRAAWLAVMISLPGTAKATCTTQPHLKILN